MTGKFKPCMDILSEMLTRMGGGEIKGIPDNLAPMLMGLWQEALRAAYSQYTLQLHIHRPHSKQLRSSPPNPGEIPAHSSHTYYSHPPKQCAGYVRPWIVLSHSYAMQNPSNNTPNHQLLAFSHHNIGIIWILSVKTNISASNEQAFYGEFAIVGSHNNMP